MTGATVTTKFQCRLTIAGNLFGRIASWIKRSQRENRDLAATVCVGVDTEGFCSETGLWISTIEEDKCKPSPSPHFKDVISISEAFGYFSFLTQTLISSPWLSVGVASDGGCPFTPHTSELNVEFLWCCGCFTRFGGSNISLFR